VIVDNHACADAHISNSEQSNDATLVALFWWLQWLIKGILKEEIFYPWVVKYIHASLFLERIFGIFKENLWVWFGFYSNCHYNFEIENLKLKTIYLP